MTITDSKWFQLYLWYLLYVDGLYYYCELLQRVSPSEPKAYLLIKIQVRLHCHELQNLAI